MFEYMPKYKYKSIKRFLYALGAWPPCARVERRKFRKLKRRIRAYIKRSGSYLCFDEVLDGMAYEFSKCRYCGLDAARHVFNKRISR